MTREHSTPAIVGAALVIGLIGGAGILGWFIAQSRTAERYVTVKGLSEKDVKADLAVWPIKVRIVGGDLSMVTAGIDTASEKVTKFLLDNGFKPEEVVRQAIRVSDRQANDYVQPNTKDLPRYVADSTIIVRSSNVDNMQKVSRMTDTLVHAGVVLSDRPDWQGSGPTYIFTKITEVKPEMLAEATHNARAAAGQFATDSGSALGGIRRASQGLFSVVDRDASAANPGEGDGGSQGANSNPDKKVRVVVTVDYFLKD